MITNADHLKGMSIHAKDGEAGIVDQFYFDDETWVIRYFTAEAGWLGDRQILISPLSLVRTDWQARRFDVGLTKSQIRDSPSLSAREPVSREHEVEYLGYYGYPRYWGGQPPQNAPIPAGARLRRDSTDAHLRSQNAVTGYKIQGPDGEIGKVESFLIDDLTWTIRYVEASTRSWWPGGKVLISPEWIERISWVDSTVDAGLTREAVKSAPSYSHDRPVTRDYEDLLHRHYGHPPYWQEAGQIQMPAVAGKTS